MNPTEPTYQLPGGWSTLSTSVDWLYYFIYWMSVVLFVGIIGAAVYFVWKYERSKHPKAEPTGHNLPLEVGWTVAPVIFLALIFHWGFEQYVSLTSPPADTLDIRVRGRKWSWDFEYPNGGHSPELHVPVGRAVRLLLSSEDVLHAFFIPVFRVKRDAVPGMYGTLWFRATRTGRAPFYCAEYCGAAGDTPAQDGSYAGHFNMRGELTIQTMAEYLAFEESLLGPHPGESNADWGQRLYRENQCFTCHSTDGTRLAGPSWRGLYGRQEHMSGGATMDPAARVVDGFQPVMPTYRGTLNNQQIDAIITYIRTLH
jgi:cytochrome c oxidase subunit 2